MSATRKSATNCAMLRLAGGAATTGAPSTRPVAQVRTSKPSRVLVLPEFAVIFRENERLIGFCGFFLQTMDGVEELEIAYRLDPSHWGQGIATEAARAVRDHAFAELQLPRVISLIHPDNIASRRVAEKNGMRPEKETVFRGFPTIVFGINRQR